MSFEAKVAIVTGASRGIGREIALQLARGGASVACVATSFENAEATASAIREEGHSAHAYACDVSSEEEVDRTVEEITNHLGVPAILVNNAGITRDTLVLRMKDEDWDKVMGVNLKGAFHMIRACAKPMMRARYGRIVNVSSVIGTGGGAGQANYAASKAGLLGLTMSIAKEFGSRNITCNAIAPGFIDTDMTGGLPEEFREFVTKHAPAGRLGTPADVAPAVLFLASEESGYITGQVLTVDGGLTL